MSTIPLIALLKSAQQQNPELAHDLRSDGPLYQLLSGLIDAANAEASGTFLQFLGVTAIVPGTTTIPAGTAADVCTVAVPIPANVVGSVRLVCHGYFAGDCTVSSSVALNLFVDADRMASASNDSDIPTASVVCTSRLVYTAGQTPHVRLNVVADSGSDVVFRPSFNATGAWLLVEFYPA